MKQKMAETKYSNILYLDKNQSKTLKKALSKFISDIDINLHMKHLKDSSDQKIAIFSL